MFERCSIGRIVAPKLIGLALLFTGGTSDIALAGCSDFAQAEVNWRRCLMDGQDLHKADLKGADFRSTSLKRSNLDGADMSDVDGRGMKLVYSTLRGTNLENADLGSADLTSADLTGANLKGAMLRRTKLFKANLRDADLTDAKLVDTDFLHADLSGALWIDGETRCAEGSLGRCQPTP